LDIKIAIQERKAKSKNRTRGEKVGDIKIYLLNNPVSTLSNLSASGSNSLLRPDSSNRGGSSMVESEEIESGESSR